MGSSHDRRQLPNGVQMQSKAFRGVRHLLVSTGVIALVLAVAAPTAKADAAAPYEKKEWVCVPTGSEDNNPWEFNHVSVNAEGHELRITPDQEAFTWRNKADLTAALAAEESLHDQQIGRAQV